MTKVRSNLLLAFVSLAALGFAGAWVAECSDNRVDERDEETRALVAKHVQSAKQANDDLVQALIHADDLQRQADEAKAQADALQGEAATLHQALKQTRKRRAVQRPPAETLEQCNKELQDCFKHSESLTRAFDLQKATTVAVRQAVTSSQEETSQERAARILETGRAEGWKKKAKKSRRQKILIGVGAGLGGVALTLGTAYAVTSVGK